MRQSHIIEIDGVFLGTAARYGFGDGYRFVGVDSRLKPMDGLHFADLAEVRAEVTLAFRRARYAPSSLTTITAASA
jgi:hypothetical protein